MFPEKKWHRLLEAEKGNVLSFKIDNAEFKLQVSADPIDPYVTYRIIDPSFEVWHRVEIRERDVTSFRERILSDWRHTENSCMNCHIHGSGRGNLSFFHLRGPKGGTILNRNGVLRKLTLKNDSMPVAATSSIAAILWKSWTSVQLAIKRRFLFPIVAIWLSADAMPMSPAMPVLCR